MALNGEQIEFLNKFAKGRWTFNEETGLVDIDGNFYCNDKKLKDFKGILFGEVKGNFYCHNNNLTSLVGSPQKVGGAFICRHNKLTSLVGAPQEVGGDFKCSYNKIKSLIGAPRRIGGGFSCYHNRITSLEGATTEVKYINFFDNPISVKTLTLMWETMREKRIDYRTTLGILKEKIPKGYFSKLSEEFGEEYF